MVRPRSTRNYIDVGSGFKPMCCTRSQLKKVRKKEICMFKNVYYNEDLLHVIKPGTMFIIIILKTWEG